MLEQTEFYPQSIPSRLPGSRDDTARATTADSSTSELSFFGNIVDTLNPLHHIPVFSSLYRYATGREIGILPRIASGALLGGPIGAGIAVIGSLIEGAIKNDSVQHNSDQPHGAKMASTRQKNTPPWYLAGSLAAPHRGAATKNFAPEHQNTQKIMVADLSLKKGSPREAQSSQPGCRFHISTNDLIPRQCPRSKQLSRPIHRPLFRQQKNITPHRSRQPNHPQGITASEPRNPGLHSCRSLLPP